MENRRRWVAALEAAIYALIIVNVFAVVVESVDSVRARYGPLLVTFDAFSVLVFTVEYVARAVWSARDPAFGPGWRGRLRYLASPLAVVDLLSILTWYLPRLLPTDLRVLRLMRLLRVARIAKLGRYSRATRLLQRVLRAKAAELGVTASAATMLILFASCLMYHVERDLQPQAFGSIPAAMWWAITTLTGVGGVDACPLTVAGKILAGLVALGGIGLVALPAGILAAGFEEALAEDREPRVCPRCGEAIH